MLMAVLPPPEPFITALLKKAKCIRCGAEWTLWMLPSFAGAEGLGGPCRDMHSGEYTPFVGWSCCNVKFKKAPGCTPASHASHGISWR